MNIDGGEELELAKRLARDGDTKGAMRAARAALEKNTTLEEAYLLLGSVCALKGDVGCAQTTYQAGTSAIPESARLFHARGMFSLELNAIEDAVVQLERAHSLTAGQDPEIAADLAYAYIFVERLDEAELLAAAARRQAPGSFAAAFTHGEVLLRKQRNQDAVAALRAALKITPDDQLARRRLAQALTQTGAYQTALEMYDSLIAGSKRDARLHAAKAGILLNMGRAKDAVAAITKAVRMAPREKKFLELLLQAQEKAGHKSGARSTRKKLRALGKDSR